MISAPTRRLRCHHGHPDPDQPPPPQWPASPSIVDGVLDLLESLPVHRRWGLIAYLSARYYEGWRPSRSEVADLIGDLGLLTPDKVNHESPGTASHLASPGSH